MLDTEIETETDQDRDQTEVLTSSSAESEVLAADRSRYQLSGVEPETATESEVMAVRPIVSRDLTISVADNSTTFSRRPKVG